MKRKPRHFYALFPAPYLMVLALFPAWAFAQTLQMQQYNPNYSQHYISHAPISQHSTSSSSTGYLQAAPLQPASGMAYGTMHAPMNNYAMHDAPLYSGHGSSAGGGNIAMLSRPLCSLAEIIQTHIGAGVTIAVIIFGVSCVISRGLVMAEALFLGIGIGVIYNAGRITEALGGGSSCPGVH